MTTQQFLDPLWGFLATILTAVSMMVLLRIKSAAIAYLEGRLHIQLTDQQRAVIDSAATHAAGLLQAKLATGVLQPAELFVAGNPHVDEAVRYVASRVPGALEAIDSGITRPELRQQVLGIVGNLLGQDPAMPTIPVASQSAAAVSA